MAIADKLQSILDSKAAIKAAIEAKGVSDVGDVLSAYPDKIASIQAGGGSGYTGHADAEGLKAIGWTDEDIEYYQTHGVNWDEEDDAYHKVPQYNIDLYGVLTIDNILTYRDRIVYLPKIDTSNETSMSALFEDCYSLVSIPQLDTSKTLSMDGMFSRCYSLVSIPQLDTSRSVNMFDMFSSCYLLSSIPQLDTSNVTDMGSMFEDCHSLSSIPQLDTSNVTDMGSMFSRCHSLKLVKIKGLKKTLSIDASLLLIKESLLYIIENAAPTEQITITISAYCYNKYNADPDVVAALAKQPNISLASA